MRDRRGAFIGALVVVWGVGAGAALINYGIHRGRQNNLQAASRSNDLTHPQPRELADDLGGSLKVFRGAVEFADSKRLVMEVPEREPQRYVFAMAGATIRVGSKEGSVGDLRGGDVVGVLYTEAEGERIARMVLVTETERR